MITIPERIELDLNEYQAGLKKAEEFHGHLCPGMFNGVKMSMVARRVLGYDAFPAKDLLIIAEIDRCLTDAVMAITGCRFGRRTLKFRDFGKFAATFCSLEHGQGVRISQKDGVYRAIDNRMKAMGIDPHDREKAGMIYFEHPVSEHFSLTLKDMTWDENDLPGFPRVKVSCSRCGETVMDNRHQTVDGQPVCRPCRSSGT